MAENACKSILLAGLGCLLVASAAMAQSSASKDYLQACAECHGADGKGAQPEKRTDRGYVSTDLTQISERNGGEFPRQKVYDAIDGRHRIAAHFHGDMPRWGARFRVDENDHPRSEQQVKDRIAALVDYVESMQQK
jgi:mono/diheme cytochrome c family protein